MVGKMTQPTARQSDPSRKSTPASKVVTSESLAADLAAFEGAGGHVEVLGATSHFKHIGVPVALADQAASRQG
jgi:hypothetical protein